MIERVSLFFDLGDTLVDLRGLLPLVAMEIGAKIPTLEARAAERASLAWAKATAEKTYRAQGPAFRPGPEIAGAAFRAVCAELGATVSLAEADSSVRRAWAAFVPVARFHDDATTAVLLSLRARADVLGIVTDSDTAMVEPMLKKLQIREMFDVVVVSDQVGAYKPDPRIYRAALDAGNARPSSSYFVSNSPGDLEGARAVGMGTVWIRRGTVAAPIRNGRDWVVRTITDLVGLLGAVR